MKFDFYPVLVLLYCIAIPSSGIAQQFSWAVRAGGSDTSRAECAYGMTIDDTGNIFITGAFAGNDTTGRVGDTQSAGGTDMALFKLDRNGRMVWKTRAGGVYDDRGIAVAVGPGEALYVLGMFRDTARFDTTTLTTSNKGYFLVRYDSAGRLRWARGLGSEGESAGAGLAVDGFGRVYASYGTRITRFSDDGAVQWTLRPGNIAFENSLALDGRGNLYVAGQFANSVTFGSTTLSSPGLFDYDIFLAKLDTAGNALWARQAGSRTPLSPDDAGLGVAVDAFGYPVVCGTFSGRAGFDWDTLDNGPTKSGFVARYSAAGELSWAANAMPASSTYTAIATDSMGNSISTGHGTSSAGGAFLTKFDSEGNAMTLWTSDKDTLAAGNTLAASGGTYFVAGGFADSLGIGSKILTSAGLSDMFVAAFGSLTAVDERINNKSGFQLARNYPNPFNPVTRICFELTGSGPVSLKVFNSAGQTIATLLDREYFAPGKHDINFDGGGLPSGVYYYRLQTALGQNVGKMVLVR